MSIQRIALAATLSLATVGFAHAASQEEWAVPSPNQVIAQSTNQQAYVPVQAHIEQGERPDYLAATAAQSMTRSQVQQDLQRWNANGLRQAGAGEGGSLYFATVREGFSAYQRGASTSAE